MFARAKAKEECPKIVVLICGVAWMDGEREGERIEERWMMIKG